MSTQSEAAESSGPRIEELPRGRLLAGLPVTERRLKLHVVEKAGDDPPMEQPKAFAAALRAELDPLTGEEAAT